jgi:hypothetical protein
MCGVTLSYCPSEGGVMCDQDQFIGMVGDFKFVSCPFAPLGVGPVMVPEYTDWEPESCVQD